MLGNQQFNAETLYDANKRCERKYKRITRQITQVL